MKKFLVISFLLFLSAAVFAEDLNGDFNHSATVYPNIDISIDGNSVSISTNKTTWNGFCGVAGTSLQDSIVAESLVDINSSHCPEISVALSGLLDSYGVCVSKLADDDNSLVESFSSLRSDIHNDVNRTIEHFANAIDGQLSLKMTDFEALITNTFVPSQNDFKDLDSRFNASKKQVIDFNASLYACRADKSHFLEKELMLGGQVLFFQCMFALAIIIILVLIAWQTGAFDKLTSGWFGGN